MIRTDSIGYSLRSSTERPDGLYVTGAGNVFCGAKTDRGLCFKEPVAINIQQQSSWQRAAGSCLTARAHSAQLQARRVLRGQEPERAASEANDLPWSSRRSSSWAIYQKTAQQIGLTIPQSMLYRADKVIK